MRSIRNEVDDTFRPILAVAAGYGRFVLIVVSGIYFILGFGWTALTHFAIAALSFAVFCGSHRARERLIAEDPAHELLGAPLQNLNSGKHQRTLKTNTRMTRKV